MTVARAGTHRLLPSWPAETEIEVERTSGSALDTEPSVLYLRSD